MSNNPPAYFFRIPMLSLVLLSKTQSLLPLPMTSLQGMKGSSSTGHFLTSSVRMGLVILLLRHRLVGSHLRPKRSSCLPLTLKSLLSTLLGKGNRGRSMDQTGPPYQPTWYLCKLLSLMIISLNLKAGSQQQTASRS
jgi:hypothetical protein